MIKIIKPNDRNYKSSPNSKTIQLTELCIRTYQRICFHKHHPNAWYCAEDSFGRARYD